MADTDVPATVEAQTAAYPAHWEADVLLTDGRPARLRPIRPEDADLLLEFYERVHPESKYMRFLAARNTLTDSDFQRFINADHREDLVFVVTVGRDIIALGDCGRLNDSEAEVAFVVQDSHHGRGVGTLLLEHLAQAGRELGYTRFVAEVLQENGKMIKAFRAAGYQVSSNLIEGMFRFEFSIHPTETSMDVMASREHRAEASSMAAILTAKHVAVIGASNEPRSIGWLLIRNLFMGGFTGRVYPVNPYAESVSGIPAYHRVLDIPDPVELAIVATPVHEVPQVVRDCAEKGVHGLVLISSGYAETGPEGAQRQADLLEQVRSAGMRLVGPNCLGLVNTAPAISLNASLSPVTPPVGRVGFFCQSGILGTAILENVQRRDLGLSTFISAGNRADVSGNDLLQYWEEDDATDVVLFYLESIGNPHKFSRIARRVGRSKPIVAVKTGRSRHAVPVGHRVRVSGVPAAAVDAMFHQAGVIQVDTLDELFDVAQLLVLQPLPQGDRMAVVSNSAELAILATDAAEQHGLIPVRKLLVSVIAPAKEYRAKLLEAVEDPDVDAVVALYVTAPTVGAEEVAEVAHALAGIGEVCPKPLLSTFLALHGVPDLLRVGPPWVGAQRGSVPSYAVPDSAVKALAKVVEYAAWANRPAGHLPVLPDVDEAAAAALVLRVLAEHPEGTSLADGDVTALLATYGLSLVPFRRVATLDQALAAAHELGWNVVLKATEVDAGDVPCLAHIWRHLITEPDMIAAWEGLAEVVEDPMRARLVVQSMGESGLPVTIAAVEDPSFGPVVSFGMSGPPSGLLHDVAYRIPPLTETDVADMVREIRVSPLFFGHNGREPVDVPALEDLIHRVAQLKDTLPELERIELGVLVGRGGVSLLRTTASVMRVENRSDSYTRRLATLAPRDSA